MPAHSQRLALLLIGTFLVVCSGCGPAETETADFQVDLAFDPSPPQKGDVDVTLTLAQRDGTPIEGADVRLEGNMNHAGMTPSFADLKEVKPGQYAGTLDFTMGGDWFVLVTVQMPDGKQVERKIDIPGVEAR